MGKSLQQSFNCRESYIFTIIMFSMLWLLLPLPPSPCLCSTSPCICFKQPLWNVNVDLLFSLSYVFPSLTRNISTTTINGKYLDDCESKRGSDRHIIENPIFDSHSSECLCDANTLIVVLCIVRLRRSNWSNVTLKQNTIWRDDLFEKISIDIQSKDVLSE